MPESLIPILVGPTGVGKSEVAFLLAKKLHYEILSADAFQVFKGMEIGTAQPSKAWQNEVPHHLIGTRSPQEGWSSVEFARAARKILDEKRAAGKKILLVGGAGFYVRALVEGAPTGAAPTVETREKVAKEVQRLGLEKAHLWLKELDFKAAERIHPNDTIRIHRALEKSLSPHSESVDVEPLGPENVQFIGLERNRENLDRLLRQRTQTMWEGGLLDETKKLFANGVPAENLLKAIGYEEALQFQAGKVTDEEAQEKIFRRTRQYAKRQWTWFRHQHEVDWINMDGFKDLGEVVGEVEKRIG